MGCLIAVQLALNHSEKVSKLILLGPPPSPLPEVDSLNLHARKYSAGKTGMLSLMDIEATSGTSGKTRSANPLAFTAVKLSLLGQDPEGYAKVCGALADAEWLNSGAVRAKMLIVMDSGDEQSPPQVCEEYVAVMEGRAQVEVLDGVGHWHCAGVSRADEVFLRMTEL
jgi:pimeloyl-ACP methyl ester carboxylesterase